MMHCNDVMMHCVAQDATGTSVEMVVDAAPHTMAHHGTMAISRSISTRGSST